MMSMPTRLTWLPMVALGITLGTALVFLYAKTRDYDPSVYFENIALLRQIKQLDAHWESDAMKSKIGINKTYDPLADPLGELSNLRQQLGAFAASQKRDDGQALNKGVQAFQLAFQEKASLVERFKSHNAVLRNSLAFLPTAAEDIRSLARQSQGRDQGALRDVAAGVNKTLLESLVYEQAASDDKAAEIKAGLDRLLVQKRSLPADAGERVDIFVAHVRTVLREHSVVDGILNGITTTPTAARIDDINNILNSERQWASEQAQKYRQYLLIFAAALISLFLYAVVRLICSHGVINRVNTELQNANNNLEQRVQQRTHELREAQAALLTTARQAGMAEIATNVLHNIGNVLNSVNVSAGMVSGKIRASKSLGLGKVVELFNEHIDDLGVFLTSDPKGKMLPSYLNKLALAVAAEQKSMIEELDQLTKNIGHIKEIVASQQSYAGSAAVFEQCQIGSLVEDAVRMSADSFPHDQISVVTEFSDVPSLLLDKHRVLQILINLLSNAKRAMDGVPDRQHEITLRLQRGRDDAVQVQIVDNGEGIAPENLTRIFAHGFTTRKDGHGFGLHSCVLAARELGGSLTAQSDGLGKGATFTLEFPIQRSR